MSGLSDKRKILVCKLGDFWVNDKTAQNIQLVMENQPNANIEIEGNTIAVRTIDGIITAEAYHDLQVKRQGGYLCKWQYWHERGQSCGHAELARMRGR